MAAMTFPPFQNLLVASRTSSFVVPEIKKIFILNTKGIFSVSKKYSDKKKFNQNITKVW